MSQSPSMGHKTAKRPHARHSGPQNRDQGPDFRTRNVLSLLGFQQKTNQGKCLLPPPRRRLEFAKYPVLRAKIRT